MCRIIRYIYICIRVRLKAIRFPQNSHWATQIRHQRTIQRPWASQSGLQPRNMQWPTNSRLTCKAGLIHWFLCKLEGFIHLLGASNASSPPLNPTERWRPGLRKAIHNVWTWRLALPDEMTWGKALRHFSIDSRSYWRGCLRKAKFSILQIVYQNKFDNSYNKRYIYIICIKKKLHFYFYLLIHYILCLRNWFAKMARER